VGVDEAPKILGVCKINFGTSKFLTLASALVHSEYINRSNVCTIRWTPVESRSRSSACQKVLNECLIQMEELRP